MYEPIGYIFITNTFYQYCLGVDRNTIVPYIEHYSESDIRTGEITRGVIVQLEHILLKVPDGSYLLPK